MTQEEKKAWLAQAANEELLNQLINFERTEAIRCSYGKLKDDIRITKEEILRRMKG